MKQSELETLRAQAVKVELPQSVREAVMAEATTLDRTEQQPATRRLTRRKFLRIGVAAAAVGVGAFLGLSIFGNDDTLPIFDDSDDNTTDSKHGFVLTAYAEGIPQSDNTVLPLANWAGGGFWGPPNGDIWYDACYSFNLSCTAKGPGAETVTYELEGPYCLPDQTPMDEATCVLFWGDHDGGNSKVVVPYGDQSVTDTQICAHFPMSDALYAANERFQASSEAAKQESIATGSSVSSFRDREAERDCYFEARKAFNEYLAAMTLHISVSYSDGTVLEKRYAIAPIDDFDEVYGAYLDSVFEITYQMDDAELVGDLQEEWARRQDDQPQLYTIREIDG